MTEKDLERNKFVDYTSLRNWKIDRGLIGRTVLRLDRGYGEYGVVTGFDKNLLYVHFANMSKPLKLHPSDLYLPNVISR